MLKIMPHHYVVNGQHHRQKWMKVLSYFYPWCLGNEPHIPILISIVTSREFRHNNFVKTVDEKWENYSF